MPEQPGAPARLGTPRLHLRCCDSTNERARALALTGAPHGALVSADEQTAGRGRQGRSWLAPARTSLLCSLVLHLSELAHQPSLLPLTAGVSLCDAIGSEARLKWPNDVVLGDGLTKLAGILVEGRPQQGWAIVGIGVNVAVAPEQLPGELRARAATLGRTPAAIEPLLAGVLAALAQWLREPAQSVLERWRSLDALRGREVGWDGGHGVAQGIDGDGRLLVRLQDGDTVALSAGDVHLSAAG
ncbi:MAG TPA: biotin--[acetyl-CoA-carboxylase] ligase [Solirubrobacteraceae bacterium]|jgi:BirA family biotin operon repressor/biotin-[acetyl-CoA-carboxylase] ligase|nr:biotin--[acetyl-CoA-carboxylase] ligase [Solirubrobacteraceae bacterium]